MLIVSFILSYVELIFIFSLFFNVRGIKVDRLKNTLIVNVLVFALTNFTPFVWTRFIPMLLIISLYKYNNKVKWSDIFYVYGMFMLTFLVQGICIYFVGYDLALLMSSIILFTIGGLLYAKNNT